jgi:hypothetical protein
VGAIASLGGILCSNLGDRFFDLPQPFVRGRGTQFIERLTRLIVGI